MIIKPTYTKHDIIVWWATKIFIQELKIRGLWDKFDVFCLADKKGRLINYK